MERWYFLVRQVLALAWRQRWLLVAAAWAVCIAGWIGVYTIPDSYESSGRLYVDTDAILTPLLHGLAIDTTANQLEIMQKTLLSRANLEKLIAATDLNLAVTNPQQKEQLVARLGHDLKITADGRNFFTVAYRDRDPRIAQEVVAGILNIFMERATASNRSDMENAQKFLNQQIASYEKQLRAAEQRRADFRHKYMDILPLESNGGVSRLGSLRVTIRDLEADLKDALAKQAALQQAERTTPPTFAAGARPSDQNASLAAAEAKLTELRSRLTDQHPDVIMTRQLIASLKATPNVTTAAKPDEVSSGVSSTRGGLSNPVYEQLKLRLIETESTIAALQRRLDFARQDLSGMEQLANAAPEVEAQSQDLDRDYDVLRKNYEELLARRETSNITAAADNGADKVRLRVIDSPQIPSLPAAPNRLLLVSLVLLAGLGAPVGLAIVLSQVDQPISDLGRLRDLGYPVLGGISMVRSLRTRPRLYAQTVGIGASLLILLLVYGGLASQVITKQKVFF
jgi:polysaccharide chain length determinant protein (PEP-CTERM system associated)